MPLYIWMPHMLGCTPCMHECPYVWTSLYMVGYPHIFGHPLYVWMLSICFAIPLYVWMPPNVWGHPKVWGISNIWGVSKYMGVSKHTGDIQTYEGHPNIWEHPNGCPPKSMGASKVIRNIQTYGWYSNIWECPKYRGIQTLGGIQTYWGIQMYQGHIDIPSVWQSMLSLCCICRAGIQTSSKHTLGHPNIWECPNIQGASKHRDAKAYRRYPNIWGHPDIQEGVQIYGGIQTYRGTSNHIGYPNIWGYQNIEGAIQTWGHPNIWAHPSIKWVHPNILGHPSIQGAPKHMGVFKHTGDIQIYGGVQTYRRYPNIWVVSKHIRAIQTYWSIQTYSGCIQTYGGIQMYWGHMEIPLAWPSMFSLFCICTAGIQTSSKHTGRAYKHIGCTNMWGISRHTGGHPNICGGVQMYGDHLNVQGASKHIGHPNVLGAYGHPISLTKHVFFALYMYSRHPNIIQTYREGIQTYRVYKHVGDIQTYRGPSKHMWGCPNVWGPSECTGGIQTYRGHSNIWGIQMYWGIWTPHYSDKAWFLCVVYVHGASKHHQNIQGASKNVGMSKHMVASKLMGTSKHIWYDFVSYYICFNSFCKCIYYFLCLCFCLWLLISFSKSLMKHVFVSQYFYYALLSHYTSYPSDNSMKSDLNLKFYSLYIVACKQINKYHIRLSSPYLDDSRRFYTTIL